MKSDERKTKAELISELDQMRAEVATLAASAKELDRIREAFEESEAERLSLVESAPGIIMTSDRDGTIRFVNRALLQYSPEEVVGTKLYDYVPAESRQVVEEALERVFRTGSTVTYEIQTGAPPDTRVWESRVGPITRGGEVIAATTISTDVTERKRASTALRKSEEQLRAIINATKDALISIDEDGLITLFNPAAEEMFAQKRADILGQPLDCLMPERYRDPHRQYVKSFFETGKPDGVIGKTIELPGLRRDGTEFPMAISLSTGSLDNQKFVIAVARDITEFKKAEAERLALEIKIQQAQKFESLGILAGGIAHDFNNLLMGMLGNSELALRKIPSGSTAHDRIRDVMATATRASELVTQMLAYSGRGRLAIEHLDLNKLVLEMIHLLEVTVCKKADLKYDFAPDVPPIEGDPTQIRQIVMNLITNASESMSDSRGVISICTGMMHCDKSYFDGTFLTEELSEGTYSYFEVADTGAGMHDEVREKIFDPFFSTKFTGRGLGLAAVLGIVRGHKGAIRVTSQPGKGSRFTALFPAVAPRQADEEESDEEPWTWNGEGAVLLVDDEETVREVGWRMLEELGFDVLIARDGAEALEIFNKNPDAIACVLLDLTMPIVGGERCFCQLRRIREDVRVILASGYDEEELIPRFSGMGLKGFIQKPYGLKELAEKLKLALTG